MSHQKLCICGKSFINGRSYVGHVSRCKKFNEWKNNTITKEFLINEYIKKERSAIDIAQSLNFSSSSMIDRLLIKFNIKKRNISESKLTQFVKDKYKNTNLIKYGYEHNFCKNHPSRQSWEYKLLINEGITNVFQRKDVIEKIANKIRETYKKDPRLGSRISSIHRKVNDFIYKELNINTKIEFKIGNLYYDIFVEPNKIIEVNGDLFHANPKIYNIDDIINNGILINKNVKDIWNKDMLKINLAKDSGYDIIIIWETDIRKNFEDVKMQIIKFLNR